PDPEDRPAEEVRRTRRPGSQVSRGARGPRAPNRTALPSGAIGAALSYSGRGFGGGAPIVNDRSKTGETLVRLSRRHDPPAQASLDRGALHDPSAPAAVGSVPRGAPARAIPRGGLVRL